MELDEAAEIGESKELSVKVEVGKVKELAKSAKLGKATELRKFVELDIRNSDAKLLNCKMNMYSINLREDSCHLHHGIDKFINLVVDAGRKSSIIAIITIP